VVIALVGITPAQGLVLCLEPDGTVALEVGAPDSGCGGCTPDGGQEQPSEPTSEENCPCIDIPIFSLGEQTQVQPRTVEISLDGPWLAPALAFVAVSAAQVESTVPQVVDPPRPAERLAHIRTVVLLV
jgi:hypothetical protein